MISNTCADKGLNTVPFLATEQIGGRVLAATRQIAAIIPKLALLIQISLVGAILCNQNKVT